jgi:hypothetical protein
MERERGRERGREKEANNEQFTLKLLGSDLFLDLVFTLVRWHHSFDPLQSKS